MYFADDRGPTRFQSAKLSKVLVNSENHGNFGNHLSHIFEKLIF